MFKKINILILFILLLSIFITNSVFAFNEDISAKSAILIERDSGRILYAKNISEKLPIASTTKILTALIAIEKGDLEKVITIKKEWTDIEGSSIYLKPKEKIKLKDLVYGLMLRSGNDAAVAIACEIAGSVDNFSVLMNKRAKEIGAYDSHFVNPHGLHSEEHYSTAYDLALITREALRNKIFREISKTSKYTTQRENSPYFYNKNKTIHQYEDGDGVKIGYTKIAGRCLVASATKDDMQLISVVLNDNNWFNTSYKLFDYGFENFKKTTIIRKNNFIKNLHIKNSNIEKIPITTDENFIYPLKKDEMKYIDISIKSKNHLTAPIQKGYNIANIDVKLKDKVIYKNKIILNKQILEKTTYQKIKEKLENVF